MDIKGIMGKNNQFLKNPKKNLELLYFNTKCPRPEASVSLRERKIGDLLEEVEIDELRKYLSENHIKKFNEEVSEPLEWSKILDDDSDSDISESSEYKNMFVESKEHMQATKKLNKKKKQLKKDIDNLVILELKDVK